MDRNILARMLMEDQTPRPGRERIDLTNQPDQFSRAGVMPSGSLKSYEMSPGEAASSYSRPYVGDRVAPVIGGVVEHGPTPAQLAAELLKQPVRAGEAVGDAVMDPSIPNVTNAAGQTALAFGKPLHALGAAGAGLGAALMDQFDVMGGDAAANPKSKANAVPPAPRIPGVTDAEQAVFEDAYRVLNSPENMPARRRQSAKETVDGFMGRMGEASRREQEMKAAEYQRKTQEAVTVKDDILEDDVRFYDTPVGELYQKNASWLPFAAAFGGGLWSRAMSGPGKSGGEEILNKWALPMFSGTTAAFGTMNAPELYDMKFSPSLNPEREAYQKGDFLLPDGHPDKGKWLAYALEQELENPAKTAGRESFVNNLPMTAGLAVAEGVSLGKLGSMTAGMPQRLAKDFRGRTGRGTNRGDGPNTSSEQSTGQQPPEGAGAEPPFQSPFAGDYPTYPRVPEEVRDDLRSSYADMVADAGNVPGAGRFAADQTDMLRSMGVNVNVPPGRVSEINRAVKQFAAQNNRWPTSDEIRGMFNNATLALPLTVGGAGYMAGDDQQEIARQIMVQELMAE
jgi:hypothetical protein